MRPFTSFQQINQLKAELAETKALVADEVVKVSQSTAKSHKATVDALRSDMEEARRTASQLVGQAKVQGGASRRSACRQAGTGPGRAGR
ncbi:MAG: hypothetical protein WDO18_12115 [Acidobacteriota bacterium]